MYGCKQKNITTINWTRTQNHLVRKQTLNRLAKPVWPNGSVFVYELSGSGFKFICSHLNFRFRACFKQGVPWHWGNYRVWIHSETYTWHRLEKILFRQCTNFHVHKDVCSAWLCPQKPCTHIVVLHWSRNISKNAPLPGCIQNVDKNQPSMPYVGHHYI